MTMTPDSFKKNYVFLSLSGKELHSLNIIFANPPAPQSRCNGQELLCTGISRDILKIRNTKKVMSGACLITHIE